MELPHNAAIPPIRSWIALRHRIRACTNPPPPACVPQVWSGLAPRLCWLTCLGVDQVVVVDVVEVVLAVPAQVEPGQCFRSAVVVGGELSRGARSVGRLARPNGAATGER